MFALPVWPSGKGVPLRTESQFWNPHIQQQTLPVWSSGKGVLSAGLVVVKVFALPVWSSGKGVRPAGLV